MNRGWGRIARNAGTKYNISEHIEFHPSTSLTFFFPLSNFEHLQPACTLTQAKRFRITSPPRPQTGGCSDQPARCPKISTTHTHTLTHTYTYVHTHNKRCSSSSSSSRAAATTAASCSDEAAHTKETLIAPQDNKKRTVGSAGWEAAMFARHAAKHTLVSLCKCAAAAGG